MVSLFKNENPLGNLLCKELTIFSTIIKNKGHLYLKTLDHKINIYLSNMKEAPFAEKIK